MVRNVLSSTLVECTVPFMNGKDSSFSNPHHSSSGERGDHHRRFQSNASDALSGSTSSLPHSPNDTDGNGQPPTSFASSSIPITYPISSATLQVAGIHVQVAYVKEKASSSPSPSLLPSSPSTSTDVTEEVNSERLRLRQVVQVELRALVRGKESLLHGNVPSKKHRREKNGKEKDENAMANSHMLGVLYLALPSPSMPLAEPAEKRKALDTRHASSATGHVSPATPSRNTSSSSSRFNPFLIPLTPKPTSSPDNAEKERGVVPHASQRMDEDETRVGTTTHRTVRAGHPAHPASASASFPVPHSMSGSSLLFPSSSASGLSSSSSFFLPRGLHTSCSFMPLDLRVQNESFTVVAIVRVLETRRVFPYVHKTLWKRQREIEAEEADGARRHHASHEKEGKEYRRGEKGKESERGGGGEHPKGFLSTNISTSAPSPWTAEGRRIQITVAITGSITPLV